MLLFSGHTYSNLSLHPFHLFFSWFFFFNSLSMLWEYWEAFFLPLSDVESNSIFKSLDVSDAHSPLYPPPNISKVNTIILEWILHFIYWCLNRWKEVIFLLPREMEIFSLLSIMRKMAHTLFLSIHTHTHPESFINFTWKRSSTSGSPVVFAMLCQTIELSYWMS